MSKLFEIALATPGVLDALEYAMWGATLILAAYIVFAVFWLIRGNGRAI